MAKIAVTPAIVLAEFMLYRKRISFRKVQIVYKIVVPNIRTNYFSN